MSFSANCKKELSRINIFSNEEMVKAELFGYMLTLDTTKNKIKFLNENEYNINRLNKLLNRLKIKYEIKMQGNNYLISFKKDDFIIDEVEYHNLEASKAVVRGAFLGSGSITEPNTRYHLEIRLESERARNTIIDLRNRCDIEVKTLNRKYSYSI